jgi:hypothetical protein
MLGDNMDNPVWNALAREAAIAAEHLGAGATILGKANYAHHTHYGQAFFSLSTGIERGAKLALAVNHALNNRGDFPTPRTLREFGHNLSDLLVAVDALAENRGLSPSKRLPNTAIHQGIIRVLTEFASNVTRYYNLDFVMGSVRSEAQGDPIGSWFRLVTEPILQKHLTPKRREKIASNARLVAGLIQPITHVSHTAETGEHLGSVYEASVQTGLTEFANPYVRMYVLQIARFYCYVMSALTYAVYEARMEFIPHLSEFFAIYNNSDSYLRNRKTWSIYRP